MKRLVFVALIILLTACALPSPQGEPTPASTVPPADTPVSATAEPVEEPAETGVVSGRVCYPSEFVPAMTAYFRETGSGAYTSLTIAENQTAYQVELPAGTYQAFAWRAEYFLGGGYTAAVPCGFGDACTDHSLLAFDVAAGSAVSGIDLCDWILTGLPLPPDVPQAPESETVRFSGLVYSSDTGTWAVDPTGAPVLLTDRIGAQPVTTDLLAYTEGDDIWLFDRTTGQARNVTNTPDRVELLWNGASPLGGPVLFSSYPVDFEVGPGVSGFLSEVGLDGGGYRVLDDQEQSGRFAVSPDGTRIAYAQGETGRLMDRTSGAISVFDPAAFGLPEVNSVGSPAWSPDGTRLSWVVAFQNPADGSFKFGLGVFDLQAGTGTILHPHDIVGMDGYPPAAVWRPDGQWLAYVAFDSDFSRNGIWLLQADGAAELYLGASDRPIWSPDGAMLLFVSAAAESQGATVLDAVSLETARAPLPDQYLNPILWLP